MGGLALIGFVFLRGAEWDIGVSHFFKRVCVGFVAGGIGFVLRSRGGDL